MSWASNTIFRSFCVLFVLRSRVAVAQGGDAAQQYVAARAALAAGRYREAEAAFVDLCKLPPNVVEVHANPGAIYFQEAKSDQAVLARRKALDLRPAVARASTLLALSLSELVNHVYVAESIATRGSQCYG